MREQPLALKSISSGVSHVLIGDLLDDLLSPLIVSFSSIDGEYLNEDCVTCNYKPVLIAIDR